MRKGTSSCAGAARAALAERGRHEPCRGRSWASRGQADRASHEESSATLRARGGRGWAVRGSAEPPRWPHQAGAARPHQPRQPVGDGWPCAPRWRLRLATGLASRARHAGRPAIRRAGRCAAGQVAERGSSSIGKSRAERDEGEGVGEGALGSPKRGRFGREARWGEENGEFLATWAPEGEEGRFEKMNRGGAVWWVGDDARVSGEGCVAPGRPRARVSRPGWPLSWREEGGAARWVGRGNGLGEEVRARMGCGAPGGPRGHARSWAAGARRVGYGELGCGVGCALAGVVGGFSLFYYFYFLLPIRI
jgi:hypothetical protein